MPTIRVTVASVDYEPICAYYNSCKKVWEPLLERLNRAEGGFQVQIPGKENETINTNEKIRQLRWNRRRLVQHDSWDPLHDWEVILLFQALKHVCGEDNVFLEYNDSDNSSYVLK